MYRNSNLLYILGLPNEPIVESAPMLPSEKVEIAKNIMYRNSSLSYILGLPNEPIVESAPMLPTEKVRRLLCSGRVNATI